MIAAFKYEVRRFAEGFKALRNRTLGRNIRRNYTIRAVITWKVTRLINAVRVWGVWMRRRREKRGMLLQAREGHERAGTISACTYICMYIHTYVYIHVYVYVLIDICIYPYILHVNLCSEDYPLGPKNISDLKLYNLTGQATILTL
jgi:hypothetical protein